MVRRARFIVSLVGAGVLLLAPAGGASASDGHNVSPVLLLPSFTDIPHASSTLVRDDDEGIAFSIHTRDLTPGAAATLVLVIFNNPAGCSHGDQVARCHEGDVVPGGLAQASVVTVTTRTIGSSGRFSAHGQLEAGDTEHALFGPGLTNTEGADVHLAISQNGTFVQASVHEPN